LVLVTSGLAYLTWQAPERFGLGFGLAATTAATAPAAVAPATKATGPARAVPVGKAR
jgi:hypothetical protein